MFDAAFAPILSIESGDSVTFECVSGGPEVMPTAEQGLTIPKLCSPSTPRGWNGLAPTF